ncbi:MAG: hypothetical protein QXV24_00405 [Nitrososphaerota archaeon]
MLCLALRKLLCASKSISVLAPTTRHNAEVAIAFGLAIDEEKAHTVF